MAKGLAKRVKAAVLLWGLMLCGCGMVERLHDVELYIVHVDVAVVLGSSCPPLLRDSPDCNVGKLDGSAAELELLREDEMWTS